MLTSPGFRVHGSFFDVMDEYAGAEDDFTLQRAIRSQMNPVERTAEAYFPPYWGRWDLRALLVSRVINFPVRVLASCDQKCTEAAMGDVFGNQNFEPDQLNEALNSAENFLYTKENLDFAGRLDRSFLPEIVRLCKENGIRLVLVRTKILRFSTTNPEPRALVAYVNDLHSYAQSHAVTLIDFSRDQRLPADVFKDMHHLNQSGRETFTEMLVQALRTTSVP